VKRARRDLTRRRAALPVETERLRLRDLIESDAEALHAIYGDAETMRYIGATGRPASDPTATRRTLASLLGHGRQHGFSLWAVEERHSQHLVGVAGLLLEDGHGPEIEAAYLFRRDRWGRGYATEALRAVLDIAESLGLDRVIALAYPENDASRRVMEKAGMVADGSVTAYGREMTRHAWSRKRDA
jgi:[ribosomal protein S5]-alanine N-acetyltransferase